MRKALLDMKPVDDYVTQHTPGLKIFEENWGGMQCAYHIFAPCTDFTQLLKGLPHDLCGVEHWAYILKGTMRVIYQDGTEDICRAGECCYWPAPHNFISEEGAEILQFSHAAHAPQSGALPACKHWRSPARALVVHILEAEADRRVQAVALDLIAELALVAERER